MFRFLTFCGLILSSPILHADLLIAPNDHVASKTLLTTADVYNDVNLDDAIFAGRNIGINFQFFGVPITELSVSVNGNLNNLPSGSQDSFFPSSFATSNLNELKIAPLWDDVFLLNPALYPHAPQLFGNNPNPNAIYEQRTSTYFAVTWQNIRLTNDTRIEKIGEQFVLTRYDDTSLSAQAVLFGASTAINGFQFQPNDIAFSYVSSDGNGAFGGSLDAAVGLRLNANTSVPYPVGSTTVIRNPQARDVLPWQGNSFILFREVTDSNGQFLSYDVSVQNLTAVPEPSSIALVLGGLLPLGWRAARKRFRWLS